MWTKETVDLNGPDRRRAGRFVQANIVLPGSGPTDLHYWKNG